MFPVGIYPVGMIPVGIYPVTVYRRMYPMSIQHVPAYAASVRVFCVLIIYPMGVSLLRVHLYMRICPVGVYFLLVRRF